ncbi:MAG TPA: tRNA (guanosine(37)-N1)-methyltransferase TrmD [bacterium]|nr:tRNA (guanosine(37)-N1)-methyltransferase TrmD [bacterium]
MQIDIVTPFPELIRGAFEESMIRRARQNGLVTLDLWDLRDETEDKHRTVDDYPYGGGAGMVMKPEPLFRAVERIRENHPDTAPMILLMTPQGGRFDQDKAIVLSKEKHLIFLCGHYRGVDERVAEHLADAEISIGDYILTGGELAAAVVVDAVVRLLPGVLGNSDSAEGDSFTCGLLDYPHYTRPENFRGYRVPEVLVSGHHERVSAWRREQALARTRERRPDLYESYIRNMTHSRNEEE